MKIEVMENKKIKVSLTINDLMIYNLNPETLSQDSPELNNFLFHIMEDVKEQTGFNPYSGQVVVEAVRTSGGITLYITKIRNKSLYNAKRIKAVCVKKKNLHRENIRYMFSEFDNLCCAIRQISPQSLVSGKLYQYKNCFYLVMKNISDNDKAHLILSEYCDAYGLGLYTETFLKEHGKEIFNDKGLISAVIGIKKLYTGE